MTANLNIISKAQVRKVAEPEVIESKPGSFIIPRKVKDVTVYYEFTAWWHGKKRDDKKISEASLAKFVPRQAERRKWEYLVAGEVDEFTVPSGNHLRSFRRVVLHDQEIVLLIDTGRRSDYSRSSF